MVVIDIGSVFFGYVYKFRIDNKKDYMKKIICLIWRNNSNMVCGKIFLFFLLNLDGIFNLFG